ncbi:MAG TPA: thioredoxin fold domain-containing protein [Thermoanaerobaculia bacterium]|nr:thioredoxin fold domain-containing protein [Thermoanaerobaculia bacterium]
MTRRIVFAALVALVLAPPSFAGTWLKSVGAAQKAAKEKNQLILVDMFAEWCGWCHRFEREVFPAAAFQDATKDIVLLRLDTEDRAEGTQFARKYSVTSLPTFLVLAPDLTIAGIIRGYAPPNEFVARLKETRKSYESFLVKLQNEPKLGKDWVGRLTLAKELTSRGAYDKSIPRLKALTAEKGMPAAIRDDAYYQLAVAYAVQSKYDESLKTIKQLTSLSKLGEAVEQAQVLAGNIYLDQGNLLGARNQFKFFIDTYPQSQYAANVETMLTEIERRLAAGMK